MGYSDQKKLEDLEVYGSYNNRGRSRKGIRSYKSKSKPPVIKFTVNNSPELSPNEQTLIDTICQSDGVYFKPRQAKKAEFKAKEPWHFIFEDLIQYQGWLYANRLTNAMYSGWDVDVFDLTESGEGLLW